MSEFDTKWENSVDQVHCNAEYKKAWKTED